MVMAANWAFIPILTTVALGFVASRAADGRLKRNQWAGIRTRSTMRSDHAWMVGHRAALHLTPWYLLTTVASCVALFVAALYASSIYDVMFVGFGVLAVVLGLLFYSASVASKAAKSADDPPG
jgi:hypothetical protein